MGGLILQQRPKHFVKMIYSGDDKIDKISAAMSDVVSD